MKITIEISDQYVETLSKWASVSRTLKQAANLIDEMIPYNETNEACMQELNDLEPAINHLHQVARTAIWLQQKK